MDTNPDVGVIGLGRMGAGIARRLDGARQLCAAWDMNASARSNIALSPDVRLVTPREMAATCATILFVLPGSREIETCLTGPDGILAADAPGQILVDLTTSHPSATKRLAELAATRGRTYLDAGMTGGAQAADAGKLTLMVGAEEGSLASVRPVLDLIATRIFHLGGIGAGHTMKLVHNMICHTIFMATSEGCRLAERAGIELSDAVAVLNAGNARSFISEARFPNHILSGTYDGRSAIATLAKDLAMAADLERELHMPAAYGPLTAKLLSRALAEGRGDQDFTTLYTMIEHLMEAEPEHAAAV